MIFMRKKHQVILFKIVCISIVDILLLIFGLTTLANKVPNQILITAHRGDSNSAPENTIPAIVMAIDNGADYIEIDVRLTRDKKVVLLHDSSLFRTTGFQGEVGAYDYNEIKDLDAGCWFYGEDTDINIPTLEQVLQLCKGKIKLNIDIKNDADDLEIVNQVVDLLQKYEMVQDSTITSTNYVYLQAAKSQDYSIKTGIIMNNVDGLSSYEGVDVYSIMFENLTQDAVEQIHKNGKEIYTWTVSGTETIIKARQMNVDNIITNDPLLVNLLLR